MTAKGAGAAYVVLTRRGFVLHRPRPIPTLEARLAKLALQKEELVSRVIAARETFSKLKNFLGMMPEILPADVDRVFKKREAEVRAQMKATRAKEMEASSTKETDA